MGVGRKLKHWIGNERVDLARSRLHEFAEQSTERHLRLAVTGLSQSGKTIFITSLVHHLLHAHRSGSLPFFEVAASGRVVSSRDLSAASEHPFPLRAALNGLSQHPPQWPQSTTGLSEVRLAIRYRRPVGLRRVLGEIGTLYLDIIDYPGEWLADIGLLEQDYASWSAHVSKLVQEAPTGPARGTPTIQSGPSGSLQHARSIGSA